VADRYRVIRRVAEGGMGEVYEAEDLELSARVALKTVRPDIAAQPRVVERFRREIALARRVTHPNVCRVFDLGFHGRPTSVTFLTMEFLEGETLSARLSRGPMPAEEALPVIVQMAAGLGAAHDSGVIHRDFKSSNVILAGEGASLRAVVTDFGLARPSEDGPRGALTLEQDGLMGSPAYMAPEQVAGLSIDRRADVYALGVVIFEMVTGSWPFVGETAMLTAVKRLQEAPPSPRARCPSLDDRWEAVILRCLTRDPAARFADVREVPTALGGPHASAPATPPTIEHRSRTIPLIAAVALAAGIGLWIVARTRATVAPVPSPAPAAAAPSPVAAPSAPVEPPTAPPETRPHDRSVAPATTRPGRSRPRPRPREELITTYPE
jgi:serine/threonine protein kinase